MSALTLERQNSGWRLALNGDWSLNAMPVIEAELNQLPPLSGKVTCDWSAASDPGIGTAWMLLTRLMSLTTEDHPVTHVDAPSLLGFLQHLDMQRRSREPPPALPAAAGLLGQVGRWTYVQGIEARGVLDFFGRIVVVIGEMFGRPQALRAPSVARHVYESGVTAIPIVSLIAFLISVIIAYLGAQQLAQFGATIFVVDLVTISVLREMGVLLTAIIVAGRSGSAFAAEIGVMQLNEETDALRAMGMNPIEVLVLPRILALVIAMPLLTVLADAMGLAGGGLLSLVNLHIPLPQFMSRLREALAPTTFWSGIIKAPIFAALIGTVGAYRGMQVRDSARELGRLTTVAVVQSIFMVILADALFAVFFMQIDF
jgi:phospholipid/cholesterol/gamma-HCH transport system permease protein